MDAFEAVRLLAANFIKRMEPKLDEGVFKSAMIMVETSDKKKLNKRIMKFLAPFQEEGATQRTRLSEDMDIFKDDSLTEEEFQNYAGQAKVCYHVCQALDKMDPVVSKQIEDLANVLNESLSSSMPEGAEGGEMLTNMLTTLAQSDMTNPAEVLSNITQSAEADSSMSQVIGAMLPHLENAMSGGAKQTDRRGVLDKFAAIDGNVRQRK